MATRQKINFFLLYRKLEKVLIEAKKLFGFRKKEFNY